MGQRDIQTQSTVLDSEAAKIGCRGVLPEDPEKEQRECAAAEDSCAE